MSKLITQIKRLALAVCLATPVVSWATPTATVVWRSNLGQSYTIGGNTYALTIPSNETKASGVLNEDGTVTVTNDWTGLSAPYFDLSAIKPTSVSVLVKFSGGITVPESGEYGAGLANVVDSDGHRLGAAIYPKRTDIVAYHMIASTNIPTQVVMSGSDNAKVDSGYMLFSYSTTGGIKAYLGESLTDLVGGQKPEYKFGSKTIASLSIGGDSGKWYNACGFKIEEVALFVDTQLTASDVADYEFPTLNIDDTATMTMTELNAKVAAFEKDINYFSASPVVTLDAEPSDETKAYLQSALWNGTVFIKDMQIEGLVPTDYGNANSTLKLSGVSGYFGKNENNKRVFENTVTPAIELVDSETEGKKYGFFASNGFSFYSGSVYYYVHTPELKGSGTYKANTTGSGALFVADKFDNFTGKLDLEGKTVWLGTGAPTKSVDTWNNQVNFPGTVRLGSSIPANYSTWNVPNGYKGTVVLTAAASEQYQVNFLTSSTWKGTCQLNWNATGKLDIVNYGNANSVIEIPSTFSALPTQNGGTDGAEVSAEVKVTGNWTVNDGWTAEKYRTTFAKLSGAGTLTVNGGSGGVGDPVPYTITRLEGFTGTIAGARGKFTFGTIVAATEPTPGTKLVNCTTTNAPVLDNTEVYYNNAKVEDIELEFKAGDGIYVAIPAYVAYTISKVWDYSDPENPSYTESTNNFETIEGAIESGADKIYLIDDAIEAPEGWEKSLEGEVYVLTPVLAVAYVDGMNQEHGYTDFAEAIAAATASGAHTLYVASAQTLDSLTVPADCTLTVTVLGGSLSLDAATIESGATLKISGIPSAYTVSGALELVSGDFTGTTVTLADAAATCLLKSNATGVTAQNITASVSGTVVSSSDASGVTYSVEAPSDTYTVTGETGLDSTGSLTVPAGTTKIMIGEYNVAAGFTIDGTTATLKAPNPVEEATKKAIDIDDDTVTLNVALVPGLYYGVAAGTSPSLSRPATLTQYTDDDSFLTVDKPSAAKGFFKVFVDIKQ